MIRNVSIINGFRRFLLVAGVLALFVFSAGSGNLSAGATRSDTDYFGQDPPGLFPVRFGPDSLLATDSFFWHGAPVFSPDLRELYWAYYVIHPGYQQTELFYMKVEGDHWTSPEHPSFADLNYGENNPYFSPGGDSLYFLSRRPGGFIFRVVRTPIGWAPPVPVNIPLSAADSPGWQFAVAKNGNVYFEIWKNYGATPPDLYVSKLVGGVYQIPVSLGSAINSDYNEIMPYIDPDERYIMFDSNRPGGYGLHDVYLSFKDGDGWTEPVTLGPQFNSATEDGWPFISPDGLYFFFVTTRAGDLGFNPYWASSAVIDSLRTTPVATKTWGDLKSIFRK